MKSEIIVIASDAYDRLRKDIADTIIVELRNLLRGKTGEKDWITPEEARTLLDIGKTKYQELKNSGAFIVSQHGRKVRVFRPSVIDFLKKNSFDSL